MVVIYAEKASLAKTIAAALGAGSRITNKKDKFIGHFEFDFLGDILPMKRQNAPLSGQSPESSYGQTAVIVHGVGHLAGLAPPVFYDKKYKYWDIDTYPIFPDRYVVVPNEDKKNAFDLAASYLKKADWIINAADPDREGELIFAYLYEVLNLTVPWKRVILSDLTENTIKKAFSNLKEGEEMYPLQLSGRARAIADWLFGMNLTVAATKKYSDNKNIITVGRVQTATLSMIVEREKVITSHKKTPFWKLFFNFDDFSAEHIGGKFNSKQEVEKILLEVLGGEAVISKKTEKPHIKSAPLLYNSTSLQSKIVSKLNFSLDESTKIIQSLYEKGLITYPRTSSEHLPNEMKEEVKNVLDMIFSLPEYKNIKPDKIAEFTDRHFDNDKVGSHTAIIPTSINPNELKPSISENEKAVYDLIAKSVLKIAFNKAEYLDTEVEITVNGHIFKAKSSEILKLGFNVLSDNKEKRTSKNNLQKFIEKSPIKGDFSIEEDFFEPPKRYTESTIIRAMETAGKDFADEELRELMKKQKKGLGTDSTRAGIIKSLFDREYITKKGKSIYPTNKGVFIIDKLKSEDLKSPETTGTWEKKLSDIANAKTLSLAKYRYDIFISEVSKSVLKYYNEIKNDNDSGYCGKVKNINDEFYCPYCKKKMIESKKSYFCSGFNKENPDTGCNFVIWKEICKKTVTKNQAVMLCKSGMTPLIKGFIGKSGKPFDAVLKLNKNTRKIDFSFQNNNVKKYKEREF